MINKNYLRVEEAAQYLGMTASSLYKLMQKKKISYYKPTGKICYFTQKDLDGFITRRRIASSEEILNGK